MNLHNTPPWTVHEWLNTDRPLELSDFEGRVVVMEAFQMLCPGCVSHGLPQLSRIAETFPEVVVIGLHSVFEHHGVQGATEALRAFLHEYKITYPVAIDRAVPGSRIPATMAAYAVRGTPTLILYDKSGQRRRQYFGAMADLRLGADIAELLGEESVRLPAAAAEATSTTDSCNAAGCPL